MVHICIKINMLALGVKEVWFDPWLGQVKDFKISFCCMLHKAVCTLRESRKLIVSRGSTMCPNGYKDPLNDWRHTWVVSRRGGGGCENVSLVWKSIPFYKKKGNIEHIDFSFNMHTFWYLDYTNLCQIKLVFQ
jgi:hypothetical protein